MTLTYTVTDPIEVAILVTGQTEPDGDWLGKEFVKDDVGFIFGQKIKMETEEPRDGFLPGEASQQQDILPKRREYLERSMCLRVGRHNDFPFRLSLTHQQQFLTSYLGPPRRGQPQMDDSCDDTPHWLQQTSPAGNQPTTRPIS